MKRLICTALAVLCFATMIPLSASAATTAEITGISVDFGFGGYSTNGEAVDKKTALRDWGGLASVQPGTTYFLPLRRDDFEWENDLGTNITMRNIEDLGIELEIDSIAGDYVIDAVKIAEQNGRVGILLDFADTYATVDVEDFRVEARLLVDGTEYRRSGFKIQGTYKNRSVPINKYDTKCTLGKGKYAVAYETVGGVKFDLGAGVSVVKDIEFTDKLYGYAHKGPNVDDTAKLEKYTQIAQVIQVETIGFGMNNRVTIDTGDDLTYYAYDSTLNYLGTTDSQLALRDKYYLATSKLS